MPPDANALIRKYCVPPGLGFVAGEDAPVQDTPAKMENHRTEAFIDGDSFFAAVYDEIDTLLNSNDGSRFFYMSAWWLGLTGFRNTLRVEGNWNYENFESDNGFLCADFDEFLIPDGAGHYFGLEDKLEELHTDGVDVRVLPWVLPFVADKRVENKAGMGGVNFPSLISASSLRRKLGNDRVVLNMLGHTFGAVHCKMVICGESNRMVAYTSGLDPADGRLKPPGLTPRNIAQSELRTYKVPGNPAGQAEMRQVCNGLNNNVLEKPIFDVIASYFATIPSFPAAHAAFLLAVQNNDYKVKIDIRWEEREWKLILSEVTANGIENDIFYLKKTALEEIKIYLWPAKGWHDVGVKVEGRAAGAIHDFFRAMWNEQLTRNVETFRLNNLTIASHDAAWPALGPRNAIDLPVNTGRQYVQVLRTVPRMDYSLGAKARGKFLVPDSFHKKFGVKGHRVKFGPGILRIPVGAFASLQGLYTRQPISFAPNGCFEFKVALKRAISEADSYIFIADQGLYALEIMDWICARMQKKPSLKVILMFGADPADPPNNFLAEAMNNHLLNSVRYNTRIHAQPANVVFYEWTGNAVHCKVTIIDDTWCAIGSANCMRRSLYTDIELSLATLEPPTPDTELPTTAAEEANPPLGKKAPSFVQRFRRDLWAHYCGIPLRAAARNANQRLQFTQLLKPRPALSIWTPSWGAAPAGVTLRPEISRQNLYPFPLAGPFNQRSYDREDADSRNAF